MSKHDLLIKNANILTMDENNSRAGSVAVSDGLITKVWPESEPLDADMNLSSDAWVLDLDGATLIPGFIDTHNHLLMYAMFRQQVNCSTKKNIPEILTEVKKQAACTDNAEWVMGWGYDNTMLDENRHPTRKELDSVVPDKPVFLRHSSSHFGVANSKALEMAGIGEDIENPEGGRFGRDEDRGLDGVLYELPALNLVQEHIPTPTTEAIASFIGEAAEEYLAHGITTNSDAGVGLDYGMKEYEAHLLSLRQGKNPIRMRLLLLHHLLNEHGEFQDFTAEEMDAEIQRQSAGRAVLDSAKLFQDGSIQGITAALREPYYNEPGTVGELLHDQAAFNAEVLDLHKRGFRVTIHGNGDRAIESILDAYEHALSIEPRSDHRHRIEHVQTALPEDLDRMQQLDVAGSFFINHVYYWGDRHKRLFLGPDRASRINPLADASARHMLYTLHSDCPITPISPLFSIWAAVNRRTREGDILGEEQCISVEKALRTMTIDGARLNFQENETGSIEAGKLADFAVLDADPTTIYPINIKDIQVLITLIGGEVVFRKESR
ncbi:hypothetical protein SAMN04488072_107119 [Lentibacillus halodurans]|uniref:Amidohydrolase 3 domain-containing protein n=1 Tax=Lentibacillus halodurans TaxID=237679 RepID=A0A1I0YEW7_9BACI|nr:amidohydrolase [Lentibacillus halodurans]SFB11741.1 hypothetical protein SAMN04488072_107119 [Lentibacillus halodurans]